MTTEARLAPVEVRLAACERIIGVMARMLDPAAAQLSREDRDALVAYARATREHGAPSPPPLSPVSSPGRGGERSPDPPNAGSESSGPS